MVHRSYLYMLSVSAMQAVNLLQLPNSLSLQVLLTKHWRQSTFAEMPLMARHGKEACLWRASMLVMTNEHTHMLAEKVNRVPQL